MVFYIIYYNIGNIGALGCLSNIYRFIFAKHCGYSRHISVTMDTVLYKIRRSQLESRYANNADLCLHYLQAWEYNSQCFVEFRF
jgi:hypothetical protein